VPRIFRRFYFGNYHLSILLMKIQQVKGIANRVIGEKDSYHIFWDIENCSLEQAIETLSDVQFRYRLADIFITSDKENSFRAWCFSKRSFNEYMIILHETKYVDWAFIKWTVIRHKSVLRTSRKSNRPKQEVLAKLKGYEPYELPKRNFEETYETGLEKYPKLKVRKVW
jgi:hypothetical protein